MRRLILALLATCAAQSVPAANYTYEAIGPQSGAEGFSATGINDAGVVIGTARRGPTESAVIRSPQGEVTRFDTPEAFKGDLGIGFGTSGTSGLGIGPGGQVVGSYLDKDGQDHAYVRGADGRFSAVDPPDAKRGGAFARSIDASGRIIGNYYRTTREHYFVFLREVLGAFKTIAAPKDAKDITAQGLSDDGRIVGNLEDRRGSHCFLRDANGRFSIFDYPGAFETYCTAMNASGQVAGYWRDKDSNRFGFVRDAGGAFTDIKPPNDTSKTTTVMGINAAGVVVGYVNGLTSDDPARAFIGRPAPSQR